MFSSIEQPTINHIKTKNVIFYETIENPIEFCIKRDINKLPSRDTARLVYKLNPQKSKFSQLKVTNSEIISDDAKIFDKSSIEKIQQFGIIFTVNDAGKINGVIHFSDYNNIFVSTFLYYRLHILEQGIRKIIYNKGYKEDDIIEFMRTTYKKKHRFHEIERSKIKWNRMSPFSGFNLSELINFLTYIKSKQIPKKLWN